MVSYVLTIFIKSIVDERLMANISPLEVFFCYVNVLFKQPSLQPCLELFFIWWSLQVLGMKVEIFPSHEA